uniref:Uncharacterized protein n=1 Tax=Strongyloides stercoralis TaxID=6248 RepID=A0A0K0DXP4_STRER
MSKKKFFSKIAKFLRKENDCKKLEKLRVARHKRQRAPSALSDQLYNYEPMPTIYEVDEYDTISIDSVAFNESFDSGRRDSTFSVSCSSDSGHSSISSISSKSTKYSKPTTDLKLKNYQNNNVSISKTCSSIIQSTPFPNVIQQPIIF